MTRISRKVEKKKKKKEKPNEEGSLSYPLFFFEGGFFFVARRLVSSTLICVYVCHDLNYMNLPFLFVSVNSSLSSKRKTTNQPTKRKETCEDDGDNSERHRCLRAIPRQMARRALEKESRRKKTFCILPACYERRCAAFPCQLLGFLLSFRFLPSFFFFFFCGLLWPYGAGEWDGPKEEARDGP